MKIQNAFRLGLFGGLGVLVAVLIGGGVAALATILTYIGAAIFLALGVDPAVSFLERHKFNRSLAIVTVLVGILAIFTGLVFAIIPVVIDQVNRLIKQVPVIVDAITSGDVTQWLKDNLPWLDVKQLIEKVQEFVSNPNNYLGGVFQTVFGIATGIFGGVIILILTLYFVASLSSLKRGIYELVPATKRERFIDISEQIASSVGRYVVGQVSLALVNGVLSFIFLTFFVHAQYSALLAFIAFLFSLIPLVGTITGSIRDHHASGLAVQRLAVGSRRGHLLPHLHAGRGIRAEPADHGPRGQGAGRRGGHRRADRRDPARHPGCARRDPGRRRGAVDHPPSRGPPAERTLTYAVGPSHSVGSGRASGLSRCTISLSTREVCASPTHKCLPPSTSTSSVSGTTANLSRASAGRR